MLNKILLTFVFLLTVSAQTVQASEDISLDLVDDFIAINLNFTGSEIVLFGGVADQGDIITVIRGPSEEQIVRRKRKVSGLWISRDRVIFDDVPSLYWIASSSPLRKILPYTGLQKHKIGPKYLSFPIRSSKTSESRITFKNALIRQKQKIGLYSKTPSKVKFMGRHLFKSSVKVPANIKPGPYSIDVYLVRDQKIASHRVIHFKIGKIGTSKTVYSFAHDHRVFYGLFAVMFSVFFGLASTRLFRKG